MRMLRNPVFLLLFALASYAQSPLGTVTGVAADATSAPVPNASVSLLNEDTGITVETTSNAAGIYSFPNLRPGKYKLIATAKGFRPFETSIFPVVAFQTVRQEVRLEVASSSSEVTVSENASSVLQVDSPSINNRLSGKQILELPTNLRSVYNN